MDYLIIQVAEQTVEAALFSLAGTTTVLKGAQSFERTPEQELPQIAATLAAGISGSPRVVLCIPPQLVAGRTVELPLTDLRKVREVLPPHLQGEVALPVEELVFDALPSGAGSFLALWAKRSDIRNLVEIFRQAGCEPQLVSTVPLASAYLPGVAQDDAVSDGTSLVLLSGGRPTLVKTCAGAGGGRQIATWLSALAMSGVALPHRLLLWGGGVNLEAELAGTDQQLPVERLELPEEVAPLFRTDATFQQLAGLYAVARACQRGELADFRRGDLAWTAGDAAMQRKMALTAALAVVVVVLLFGMKFMQYRAVSADLASLDSSIATIYRDIFPGRNKAIDELAEVKGELKKLSGAGSSKSVLDLLKLLAEAKGGSINGLLETELDGSSVRLKGDAASTKGVTEFKTALEGKLASVQLGETKSRPDGSVTFTLTATLKEER